MFNKLWNILFGNDDYCEHNFGMWEKKTYNYSRAPKSMEEFVRWGQIYEKSFRRDYQERKCKTCGYVDQKELEYGE